MIRRSLKRSPASESARLRYSASAPTTAPGSCPRSPPSGGFWGTSTPAAGVSGDASRCRLSSFSFSAYSLDCSLAAQCRPLAAQRQGAKRGAIGSDLSPKKWQASGKQHFYSCRQNLRKYLVINGVPGGIRTHNLLIRSQMLYPVELQTRNFGI